MKYCQRCGQTKRLSEFPPDGRTRDGRTYTCRACSSVRVGPAAETADPVGTVEVADRAGVSRSTVDQWRQRDLGFPAPRWQVGGRPAWNWPDVATWLKATGRST